MFAVFPSQSPETAPSPWPSAAEEKAPLMTTTWTVVEEKGVRPTPNFASVDNHLEEDDELAESDPMDRVLDRFSLISVLIVDLVLLAEVAGPWPRSLLLTLYLPSGIFLVLSAMLCWIGSHRYTSIPRTSRVDPRKLSAWAMFLLASLFLLEAYLHLTPSSAMQTLQGGVLNVWLAYVALLATVWTAGVGLVVRGTWTYGRRRIALPEDDVMTTV
ncbi:hypothetical protein BKA62DRAFT_457166 [Auriculariales sp. MPI-PUGE-AT-0066]|nr:hypothetical protein BKA62DRAFT_457166 [Auriculariales sp. MPI-PUGE-AT-0066]